ncbi:MAG: B12-binding domain-containing radical SAM protein [Candidatus Scalindua sp.]|jgi:anaerobic magnesium-protoporphyrin IX monomethyl ester cyclase|nr:B12-binding domain-containing radical SAM protein [Candidatus Scalindua sp.]
MRPDIVFIQQYAVPYFGVLSITSHLSYRGYKAEVLIESLEEDIIGKLKQLQPKLIGISLMSPEHKWLINLSQSIHQSLPEIPIIAGGVHGIFYPEQIISQASVDLVCHSDGEDVIINVIKQLNNEISDWSSISGLSYKTDDDEIRTTQRADLVPFDDNIIADRNIYYNRYPQLAKDKVQRFFSSRGCHFRCSFCYNSNIHDVFKEKGKYIRQKSVRSFIQEITSEHDRYPIDCFFFSDDLFTFDKKWLKEFLDIYKERVGRPFWCTTRANTIDENTARMLAEAGCITASFGIETGNYNIRKNVLKKNITDEKIIRCGNLLHDYGINTQTANMFCLPDETVEDALRTIDINIKAKTSYAFTALFMPFPNTALCNYCIEKGLLKPDYSLNDLPTSFLITSILDIPKRQKESIKNVHRLAFFFIKWPWLFRLFKKVVYLNLLSPLFHYIFLFATVLRHKEERGISWWATIRYAWRLRKSI